jgi:DNA-binding MarR family transcriptional regulator
MSHRTERLSSLRLLERLQGLDDRRNVLCRITDEGVAVVQDDCAEICDILHRGSVLSRTMPSRLIAYVTAMGTICFDAGEQVLLVLGQADEAASTVGGLSDSLGLLQPTVSMAVSTLVQSGAVVRMEGSRGGRGGATLCLSDQGRERADELLGKVQATVVRRIR